MSEVITSVDISGNLDLRNYQTEVIPFSHITP
jgi:hypothetical protein